jgi:ligand-binding sensor domain-containing protein
MSIDQDSTGYLWFATQDGLNKYNGQSFKKYKFIFEDITNVDFSDLGKVYRDREDKLWIIPSSKIPHQYNSYKDKFEPQQNLNNINVVFQDSQLNHWFGSFENGLFKKKTLLIRSYRSCPLNS